MKANTHTMKCSGGDPSENSYHPLEPSFYSRPPPQPGSAQYDQQHQYDTNYGYYPLNQGNPGSGGPYPEPQQQRNFSPNYTQQQSPHYAPLSPASPAATGYLYTNHHTSNQPSGQQTHHGMNYNNPQQSIYSSTVSPGHYGSPNHGQHSSYSPSSSQQWPPQQASPADYTHHSSSSPQRSVLAGSPSATPSPAHTPTSPPPPSAAVSAMSGQFPAHHHGRHPPMGSPQSAQGHGLPTWGHPGAGQAQGMGMHPGGGMGGPPPQAPGYYPPPHPSMMGPGRGMQGPPQHAHMSSAAGADRHSPHHAVVPGAWNNLGMPVTKVPGSHEGGRGPPSTSHPQTNSGSNSGGPGNPLFSLQMLVNQDMNRNAAAVAAATAAAQASSYRGQTPTAAHQQESVDLSPASGEAYPRIPQQSVPIPLTRTDKQPEHSSLRNGSIIASSTSVSSTNVTSPPTPLNGEVSSDSGIGSSSTVPTPSSIPDNSTTTASGRDINKPKSVVESKSPISKETVSVIAQTPPREKPKCTPQVVTTVASSSSSLSPQSSEAKLEKKMMEIHSSASSEIRMDSSKPSPASGRDTPVQPIRPPSADSQERSNPIIRTITVESSPASVESTTNVSVPATNSNTPSVKLSEDSLSIPSPTQSTTKDSTSPVRSPKSGSLKRTKKVDSILENLVESGCKKFGGTVVAPGTEQPPQVPVSTVVVAPASVIVSPAVTNEDSSSGFGRDVRTPSPGVSPQKPGSIVALHKSPTTVREEDVVSPTFSNDDVDNGKPRRKRKLDKPIRVSKTASDTEGTKSGTAEDSIVPEENQKLQESEIPIENKDLSIVCPSSEAIAEQATAKSIENPTKDDLSSSNTVEKLETPRRRSSSEGSSASLSPKPTNQRIRRKSTSDQQDDADDLLSALVSEQLDKPMDPKPEVKNAFIEVETELEKMFAGIVETDEAVDPLKLDDTSSPVSVEVSPTTKALETLTNLGSTSVDSKPASSMKRGRPKGSRNGTRRSSESIFGTSSTDSTPKKKKKQPKRSFEDFPSTSQFKKVKRSKLFQGENSSNSRDSPVPKRKGTLIKSEPTSGGQRDPMHGTASYDSGSNTSSNRSRGPVVHVEGPKDSPYYVSVINAPSRGEDEEGNEKGGTKKQSVGTIRRKNTGYHNDLEYRGKVSRASGRSLGLFSSTLSARYDAHTTDPTWICVFCKRGPHSTTGQVALGSGDLFGPYLVGKEKADDGGMGSPFIGCEPSADERDITEEQKRGSKNKRSLRGAEMVEQFHQKMSKKVKRSLSIDNSPVLGMVPMPPSGTGREEAHFEVWVHEECAVWAAGVHLVGSRIVGLQEAVWGAVRTLCSKCGEGGANVGCVRRACEWRLHYGCALDQGWDLDEEAYIARCNQHKNGTYAPECILPT